MRERYRMRKKKRGAWTATAVCLLAAALICAPLLMIPGGSLMDGAEMNRILAPILGVGRTLRYGICFPFIRQSVIFTGC